MDGVRSAIYALCVPHPTNVQACARILAKNKLKSAGRIRFLVLGFWDKSPGYAPVYAISPGLFRPLPRSSRLKEHDSACDLILSVDTLCAVRAVPPSAVIVWAVSGTGGVWTVDRYARCRAVPDP